MEEKILIQSEKHTLVGKVLKVLAIIATIAALCIFTPVSYGFSGNFAEAFGFCSPCLAVAIICGVTYYRIYNCELVITDKRVYGVATFGKRVDLPLDSVSAAGISSWGGVDVGTSSGRIHFKLIKNKNEMHSVLSNLLMQRQRIPQSTYAPSVNPTSSISSNMDAIKKLKDLLDMGAITQEEFDAKKKELLGL